VLNDCKKPPTEIRYQDDSVSLSIKPLEEKDAEEITKAIRLSMKNLLPFMDWAHDPITTESQRDRIKKSRENYSKGEEYEFAIFDRNSCEFLMSACWHVGKNRNKKSLEIGYWTSAKHSNKGLATLVTKILTVVGFDFMGSDRIEIGCNKQNETSHRIIKKCGFQFEGEIRNYFNSPTLDMIKNGYSTERTYLQYALLPDDRGQLPWYKKIKELIEVL